MPDFNPPLHPAPGSPGMPPRWTRGAKDAIGTAYAAASRVWFTLAQGTVTEVYYPTVDRPQVRDLQFLISDGATFMHGERRDCDSETEVLAADALGFNITTSDRHGRYRLRKQVLTDPHSSCLLAHAVLEPSPALAHGLQLYVLCAPHLLGGGWHNHGLVASVGGRTLLLAERDSVWLALGATVPFRAASAGFVGVSDGWSELAAHLHLSTLYDDAADGNIALTGELDLSHTREFTLGLAFGRTQHAAVNSLLQALGVPFAEARARFLEQWRRAAEHKLPLQAHAQDGGKLYDRSVSVLHAHEDKTYPGALIASLCIPWGEAKGDEDLGGYHLVWTRDMVNSAGGLLASGDHRTALRALVYLATSQREDGGFAQNFWIDGRPYWGGIQLDEVAFPIMLAWRLHRHQGLCDFDPYVMVMRAAGYLMRQGPATPQERWEEAGGYSPSTLAAHIAGLVCAAEFAQARREPAHARLMLEYADFLESHIEPWTVTHAGALVPGVSRHYVRINPAPRLNHGANEDLEDAVLHINNRPPGLSAEFPATHVVDAGFLELVRYGVRRAGDPVIEDSLRVVDATLKASTPFGPCWRRYNHDGYGQKPDGSAFNGWGRGRPWPLLCGERGHYELASGRSAADFIRALERFANRVQMLTEQIWDQPDLPQQFLYFGRPTGAAMPLMWAHAEYVKLLRSIADGQVFDLIPAVADRYRRSRPICRLEIWNETRQIARVPAGSRLRVQDEAGFFLHFSLDDWATVDETRSTATAFGFEYVDVVLPPAQAAPLRFTRRYLDGRWEGIDHTVAISPAPLVR